MQAEIALLKLGMDWAKSHRLVAPGRHGVLLRGQVAGARTFA